MRWANGKWRAQALGHVQRRAAHEGFALLDFVAKLLVERDIAAEGGIGEEAQRVHFGMPRELFGEDHEGLAMPPALVMGVDREVLDPEMIGTKAGLQKAGELSIDGEEVKTEIVDGFGIVGQHGAWLAPDDRGPLGIGGTRKGANGGHICRSGRSEGDELRRHHKSENKKPADRAEGRYA